MRQANRPPARRSPEFQTLERRRLMSAALPFGAVTPGVITTAGQANAYAFTVGNGAQVDVDTSGTRGDTYTYVAELDLRGPTGGQVLQWSGNAPAAHVERGLAAGTYTLTVNDAAGKSTGSYDVGLEGLSPTNPSPTPLVNGAVANGSIDGQLVTKEYALTLAAPTTVHLETNGQPF